MILEHCANSNCVLNNQTCDPYVNCSFEYQPLCASNLHNYPNECQMQKYACQSNVNLTKLHDGTCSPEEQQRLREGNEREFLGEIIFGYYFSV